MFNLSRPALASMIASKTPLLSLSIRVPTLPLKSLICKSGLYDLANAPRLTELVPITAPSGKSSKVEYCPNKTSLLLPLGRTPAIFVSAASSVSISFIE